MTKRTKPDHNQDGIENAAQTCGCVVIDLHDVPANLPEHTGLPDLMLVAENALTVILSPTEGQPHKIKAMLERAPGVVRVLDSAVLPVEVKTEAGELTADQVKWWQCHGLKPLVFRTIEQVMVFFGRHEA